MSGTEALRKALSRLAVWSSVIGVGGFAATECLYTVDGGERAVIWNRFQGGIQREVVGEGMHFRIPFVEYPTMFDVRLRPRIVATRTGTKDLQTVQISLRVLSRPDPEHLFDIYQKLGEDFDERVLPSIVNEVLKATVVR
jgi:regulator of protease activity HflC (stomatin/prohibitin superfamily)